MKQVLFLCIMAIAFTSCNSQRSKAMQDQMKAYQVLKSLPSGAVVTADGSWTMTATIDGKKWIANYMYPPAMSGRIIGHKDDESIELPYPENELVVGHKTTFREGNATDLFTDNFYGGRQGDMTITKVSGGWAEGTFHFLASSTRSSKTVEVTDGFFRIKTAQ